MHLPQALWYRSELAFLVRLRFIDKGFKVNADNCNNKVLKPYMKNDVPRLFSGRENDIVLHQDSVSSHSARKTIKFLNERRLNYISPAEWMPKSRGAAKIDYGI